MDFRKNSL